MPTRGTRPHLPRALTVALTVVSALVLSPALGVAVAACVVGLHGYGWGLALGLVTTVATLVALPGGWWSRFPFGLGWAATVVVLSVARAEGDYLVASDVSGYVLLLAVPCVAVAGAVGIRGRSGAAPGSTPQPAPRAASGTVGVADDSGRG